MRSNPQEGDRIGGCVLAFTFPGQGSQKPSMGSEWVEHESWELVDEASAACGRDVSQLLLAGSYTHLTLPTILLV